MFINAVYDSFTDCRQVILEIEPPVGKGGRSPRGLFGQWVRGAEVSMLGLRRSEKVQLLRQVPLFRELNQHHVGQIAGYADEVSFDPGSVLMRQGQAGREFFLIADGSVRVERDGQVVAHLGHGDFVGEMSLLDGQVRSATVIAETPSTFLVIRGRSFDELLEKVPDLARKMLYILSRRIRDLEERFVIPVTVPKQPELGSAPENGAVMVEGVLCTRNHLNEPAASYCSVCGVSMLQRSRDLVLGPRPPLGLLLSDNGAMYVLDSDYVIGQSPGEHELVRTGRAKPLILVDDDNRIAPQHAGIVLKDWDVLVHDYGSETGTRISAADAGGDSALLSNEPVRFQPGTILILGDRTLRFYTNVLEV
jgi:Cyclic nucleotide-binding domain